MLKITELDSGNMINIRVEGQVTEKDMKPLLTHMEEKIDHDQSIRLYFEIPSLDRFEPEAIIESLKHSLNHLENYLSNVDKIAIVTDKDWISSLVRIEDKILPGIEEKAFTFDESEKAVEWLKQ